MPTPYVVRYYEDLLAYHDDCATENNISAENLSKYKNQEYAEDEESYCHVKCLTERMSMFNRNKGFQFDNTVTQLAAANHKTVDEIRPIVFECQKLVSETNVCLWAYKGFLCLKQHNLHITARKEVH